MTDLNQVFEGHLLGQIYDLALLPKLWFGIGASDKIGELGKGIATNNNAAIVTDGVLVKLGIINSAKESLESAGFNVDICESKAAEPVIDEVRKVVDMVRGKDYGLIVGIGGGSAMDRAKSAALMAKAPGDIGEYLFPNEKPLCGSIPKIMVPTTAGTGSECSSGLVVIVSDEKMGRVKSFLLGDDALANMAVIDPVLHMGAPPRVTAGSGMDAMAHTAESAMCLAANPFTDALAFEGIKLVAENLRTAVHQGNNVEARWNMAWAASLGGMICALPWIAGPATPAHVASESISAKYGFPHGESCGVLLPFTYWFNMRDAYGRRKIAMIAEAMGEDVIGLSSKQAAEEAITATFDLLEDISLPTSLKEYDIPKSDLSFLTEYVTDRGINVYGMNTINPVKVNLNNIREFLEVAWEGREAVGL